jgi:hypothetical protein
MKRKLPAFIWPLDLPQLNVLNKIYNNLVSRV